MKQEVEIEFKNILTKKQYNTLLNIIPFQKTTMNENYYFETKDFKLAKVKSALRIRKNDKAYTLTLKQPKEGYVLETNIPLAEEEALSCLKGNFIQHDEFTKYLSSLGIRPDELHYFGKLITKRKTYYDGENLYVLDHSFYNDKEDFELELEVQNREKGLKLFTKILNETNIERKKTPSKIERFFKSLNNLNR